VCARREQPVRELSEPEPHADIEQHLLWGGLEHDRRAGGPHDHFLDRSEAAATAVVPSAIIDDLSGLDRLDADDREAMHDQHVATDHDSLRRRHLFLGLPGREPVRRGMPSSLRERWRDRGTQHEERGDRQQVPAEADRECACKHARILESGEQRGSSQ